MSGRAAATAYVVGVAALATFGFVRDSTSAILLAAAITLPSGAPAVVGYYVTYGLLALAPGANPSESIGSATCTGDGPCRSSSAGDAAAWFLVSADVLGVAALTAAAVTNLLLVRVVRRHRRPPGRGRVRPPRRARTGRAG